MNNSTEKEYYFDAGFHDVLAHDKCQELIPVHVYICFLMTCGLFGNILTCVFYSKKQVTTPTSRLIVVLAYIDMVVCVFMPKNIIVMCRAYKGYPSPLCSTSVFFDYVAAISSILILISIASFRVRALAQPTSWQFSVRHANRAVVLSLIIAVTLSMPSTFTHKTQNVIITIDSFDRPVIGHICKITPELESRIFNIFLFVIQGAATITLGILYTYIGTKIYKYYKAKKRLVKQPISSMKTDTTDDDKISKTATLSSLATVNNVARPDRVTVTEHDHTMSGSQYTSMDINYMSVNFVKKEVIAEPCGDGLQVCDVENKQLSVQTRTTQLSTHVDTTRDAAISSVFVRQVVMLFVITLIFIMSFLPYLITARLISRDKSSDVFVNKYQFGLRSFLINSAANPFVYGLFSSEFRNFVKSLFLAGFNRCFKRCKKY